METIFDISIENGQGPHSLIMELAPDGCNYAFYNMQSGAIDALKYTLFDEFDYEAGLSSVLEQLQQHSFEKVVVGVLFQESLLVPREFQASSDSLLSLLFERPQSILIHDAISEWQLINTYAISSRLYDIVKERLPQAIFVHNYTASLKNNPTSDTHILLHFTSQYFRVILQKERKLQLAQIYPYKSVMDVSYYLLKICSEFELLQQEVLLYLSGLVSDGDQIFESLQAYFPKVLFEKAGSSAPEQVQKQPLFSSLYNLASCAL